MISYHEKGAKSLYPAFQENRFKVVFHNVLHSVRVFHGDQNRSSHE